VLKRKLLTETSTVSDQIFERLRIAIFTGELPPGAAITENALATKYKVSQATVRQALLRLEHLELVVRTRHRETIVANQTQDELSNRIAIRKPLDILACQTAANCLVASDFSELESTLAAMGASEGSLQADEAFHHKIWESAGNPLLTRALKQLSAPMFALASSLRRAQLQDPGERARSHRDLMAALQLGKADDISRAVEHHLDCAYSVFRASGFPDIRTLLDSVRLRGSIASGAGRPPRVSLQRAFLRWAPTTAIIRDSEGLLVYGNKDFEGFVGRRLDELVGKPPSAHMESEVAARIIEHEQIVREQRIALLTVERLGGKRMTLRFPIELGEQRMVGSLGFDFTAILNASRDWYIGNKRVLWESESSLDTANTKADVNPSLLTAFLNALPAIATLKDLQGRMLWTNVEYERVTHRMRDDVLGSLPTENWGRFGDPIVGHDAIVRQTRKPHLTFDWIPVDDKEVQRVNIRFPVFDEEKSLQMTASLGLDYRVVIKGRAMLDGLAEGRQAWTEMPLEGDSAESPPSLP
jgi:DNA-binding GntR family transcriptional regulator